MKALVTGGSGFIGSNLCRRLLDENFEVSLISRKSSGLWRINDIKKDLNFYNADLMQLPKLCKVVKKTKPDFIFHLAAYGAYPRMQKDEKKILETNFLGTSNLLKASLYADVRCFVNTGSSSEYGRKSSAMKESDLLEPDTYYGICKAASTMLSADFARKNSRNIVTLRPFSAYGYYEESFRLVPYAIMRCLKDEDLKLTSGEQKRDFVFMEDVVDSYICATKLEKQYGTIFNVGSGEDITIKETCTIIKNTSKSKSRLLFGSVEKESFESGLSWKADTSSSRKKLKWAARTGIEEGIAKTVEWFKKNSSLYNSPG